MLFIFREVLDYDALAESELIKVLGQCFDPGFVVAFSQGGRVELAGVLSAGQEVGQRGLA